MPRGGARPGAGRKTKAVSDAIKACEAAAKKSGNEDMTPLDFMLATMRDEEQDMRVRVAMAQAAAPYIHAKPSDATKGKKEERQDAAERAATGKFAVPQSPKLVVDNRK